MDYERFEYLLTPVAEQQIADWPDTVTPATTRTDQVQDMLARGREVRESAHPGGA